MQCNAAEPVIINILKYWHNEKHACSEIIYFYKNRSSKNYITYKSDFRLQQTGIHSLSYYTKRKINLDNEMTKRLDHTKYEILQQCHSNLDCISTQKYENKNPMINHVSIDKIYFLSFFFLD